MKKRPIMRYPGGKFALAKKIVSLMPSHACYVELFGGAASVLMQKTRSQGEVYNDMDGNIVNVFRVLRDPIQAEKLKRLLKLTPFAYEEYLLAYEPSTDPIENARRIIYRSYAGIGSDSIHRRNAGFRGLKNYQSSVTAAHKENAKLARQGKKTASPGWIANRWQIRLEQDENRQWLVFINGGKNGLPASDVEVSLWLDLQEAMAT